MNHWFIDTIDPRAGLAFAARRASDLLRAQFVDGPAAFISPPYFAPEIVDGRGLGLGLARGRGQIGVFVEGEELPFDSLAAVAEFVRRVYLRGSGGNGPGEDGAPPLPPLPEGGPERGEGPDVGPKPTGGKGDPVDALIRLGERQTEQSKHTDFGASTKADTLAAASPTSETPVDRLVRAAVRLLITTLERRPAQFSGAPATDWLQTFDLLTRVIVRLGLLPLLARAIDQDDVLRTWLALAMPPPHGFDWMLGRSYPYPDPTLLCGCSEDPYGDLARLPVPDHLAATAGPHQGSPSLRSVLQTVLATPAERLAWGVPVVGEARAELAFFAACSLNVGSARPPLFWSEEYSRGFVQQICLRGQAWMQRNLPKRVFSQAVETLITTADQVPA